MAFSWRLCLVTNPEAHLCSRIPVYIPIQLDARLSTPAEFEGPGLNREVVRDIHILATIDRLSDSLSADLAHDIQRSAVAQMKAIGQKLGKDFQLERLETD